MRRQSLLIGNLKEGYNPPSTENKFTRKQPIAPIINMIPRASINIIKVIKKGNSI